MGLLVKVCRLYKSFSFIQLLGLLVGVTVMFRVQGLTKQVFSGGAKCCTTVLCVLVFSGLCTPVTMLASLPFAFLLLATLLLYGIHQLFPITITNILVTITG